MKVIWWVGSGAGSLLVAIACCAAAMYVPDRSVDELRVRWAKPPSTFLDVAAMRVHLRDEGNPRDPHPIVLLHGSGSSLHTWAGWAKGLAAKRRVVSFDLPGFGLTGPSPDADYSVAGYVRFTNALLDRLGIARAVLVGRAIGGEVAWTLALAEPARVERLVLISSGGYPIEPVSVPLGFRIAALPVVDRLTEFVLPRGLILTSLVNLYGDPTRITDETVDGYFELTLREGNRRALVQQRALLRPGAQAHRIRELRLPTLILWGGRDRLFPPELGERFQRDIPGSELVVFADLGHLVQEEDPERTVAPVQRFLGEE